MRSCRATALHHLAGTRPVVGEGGTSSVAWRSLISSVTSVSPRRELIDDVSRQSVAARLRNRVRRGDAGGRPGARRRSAIGRGRCSPRGSPNRHTRLSIDEIDAAIAAGARKGEALSRQLSAEGLANIPQRTKPMLADTDLPAAWACRVQLTACIASGDGRHSERERSCNKGFEAESVACGKSAVGETEAERIRHFENCRDIGNLTRRACIKRSESTRSKEAVLCRSTHNCDPLPNAAAVPGAADCGGADRSGGEESSRASQSCLQPVRPLATAP